MGETRPQDLIILGFYLLSKPVLEKEQEFSLLERSNTSATTLKQKEHRAKEQFDTVLLLKVTLKVTLKRTSDRTSTLSCVIKT